MFRKQKTIKELEDIIRIFEKDMESETFITKSGRMTTHRTMKVSPEEFWQIYDKIIKLKENLV